MVPSPGVARCADNPGLPSGTPLAFETDTKAFLRHQAFVVVKGWAGKRLPTFFTCAHTARIGEWGLVSHKVFCCKGGAPS